ncbi:MAG: PAS domain-containing sensor histidine kinase [Deltaproteobacteria bacterium]|nr:PAS domain-containing sensor histidine kinase [Deltaproteobacteria bacterium]
MNMPSPETDSVKPNSYGTMICITALVAAGLAGLSFYLLDFAAATSLTCGMTLGVLPAAWFLHKLNRCQQSRLPLHEQIQRQRQEIDMLLERYQVLTDNLAASIIIRNNQGTVAYCSPYTAVPTGYALAEIYEAEGDFFLEIIHDEDRDKYLRALKVAAQGEAFQLRYRFFHKTGIEMWAETRTVPIIDERGEISSSLSITLDITGLIRRQRQIEEKNRDLEDFSYMISHDLKAPLFTIKGMLNVIEEDFGGQLDPDLNEALKHIGLAVRRLDSLVGSVLEYSRIGQEDDREEAVSLSALMRELKQEFSPQLAKVQATLEIESDLPTVVGDRLKIYQIFSNLIGNALKYRSPERALLIEVRREQSRTDRFAKISVKDNGSGIPAGKIDAIFRPFQRSHGKEIEGSGIGLACVKKLLEKLGGEIEVKSVEGQGSEFTVTLRSGWKHADTDRSGKETSEKQDATSF